MLGWIVLAFVVMPFVELWLLVQIGERIGFWPTLYIVLGTGLLGGVLARYQGGQAWREILTALREGRAPKRELVAGALFLFGAALLLTPGVITDGIGFALMVPWIRRGLAGGLISKIQASDRVQTYTNVGGFGSLGGQETDARQDYDVEVEGYARDGEDEDPDGDGGPPQVP